MTINSPAPKQALSSVRLQGFTVPQLILSLVSAVLLVIIIGKLVSVHNRRVRCNAYLSDVQHFAYEFQAYYKKEGSSPPGNQGTPGYPKGMEPYLKESTWLKPSPFGGLYSWISPLEDMGGKVPNQRAPAPLGAIALAGFPPKSLVKLTPADLTYLQEQLNSGKFPGLAYASGFTGWPVCLVAPPP